jgi:hypothetical protein
VAYIRFSGQSGVRFASLIYTNRRLLTLTHEGEFLTGDG